MPKLTKDIYVTTDNTSDWPEFVIFSPHGKSVCISEGGKKEQIKALKKLRKMAAEAIGELST